MRISRFASLAAMLLAVLEIGAFVPPFAIIRRTIPSCVSRSSRPTRLFSSSALEDEVKSMRIGELKSELESYGISTRSFLEKSELVNALVQARKEGKTPVATTATASSSSTAATSPTATAPSPAPMNSADRQARLEAEIEACKAMKVGELKAELEGLGVSTNTFFEKSEFVRTLAEARVDGVKKSKKKKRRAVEDDVEEVTAAKVEVITNDSVGPKTKKTRDANAGPSNPFGGGGGNPFGGAAGSNPFGGAAGGNPFGGMGGGSIEDMLKGMGGMGGGNPFGGAAGGGNPFGGMGGNPMEAAQKAMSNPKVQAVMAKAQQNPKVMKAVQESMGNPANMMKYMSDPEVGPILKELQEAMMG